MSVHVFIHGLVMWWMAGTPAGIMIVPDLTAAPMPHVAKIYASRTAFVSGTCPPPFESAGKDCVLDLNAAGRTGGVKIEFESSVAELPFTGDPFCGLPGIVHD